MPSLVVNTNGDMVIGFSGSSANQYVSAYYWGRLNIGTSPANPVLYFGGKDWLDTPSPRTVFRWGDYSHTTLDPDGLKFWTIQEHAVVRLFLPPGLFHNAFGTRIGAITPF